LFDFPIVFTTFLDLACFFFFSGFSPAQAGAKQTASHW